MAAAGRLVKISSGTLRARIINAITEAQITSGTVTAALLDETGTTVFTGRSMTYSADEKLDRDDASTGCWTCAVSTSEVDTTGTYTATITAVSSGKTAVHEYDVAVVARIDQ